MDQEWATKVEEISNEYEKFKAHMNLREIEFNKLYEEVTTKEKDQKLNLELMKEATAEKMSALLIEQNEKRQVLQKHHEEEINSMNIHYDQNETQLKLKIKLLHAEIQNANSKHEKIDQNWSKLNIEGQELFDNKTFEKNVQCSSIDCHNMSINTVTNEKISEFGRLIKNKDCEIFQLREKSISEQENFKSLKDKEIVVNFIGKKLFETKNI